MRRVLLILTAAALGAACTSGGNSEQVHGQTASPEGGSNVDPDGGAGADGSASTTAATCADVLVCASDCPDDDDGCSERCLARGTDEAQRVTIALATCFEQNGCTDDTCIRDACGSELTACLEQSVVSDPGEPTSEPPPATGEIPAELVGSWLWASSSTAGQYDFTADGNAEVTMVYSSPTGVGCQSTISTWTQGVAVADASTLVIHRREGTQTSKLCGGSPSTKPIAPFVSTYTYVLDTSGRTLSLTSDGTTQVLTRE